MTCTKANGKIRCCREINACKLTNCVVGSSMQPGCEESCGHCDVICRKLKLMLPDLASLANEDINILQRAVIDKRTNALQLFVHLGIFRSLDTDVRDKKSKYFGKRIDEIAKDTQQLHLMEEIERCRLWEDSLPELHRTVRRPYNLHLKEMTHYQLTNTTWKSLQVTDREQYTYLHWAAVAGNLEIFRIFSDTLCCNKLEYLLMKTKDGLNAMQLATEMGNYKLVKYLLKLYDIYLKSRHHRNDGSRGHNRQGHLSTINDAAVDFNKLLEITARNGDIKTFQVIIGGGITRPTQHLVKIAVENNRAKFLKMLLMNCQLDPNYTNPCDSHLCSPGWPLRNACSEGHEDIIKVLLRHPSCDLTLTNQTGRNCLHWAAINGSKHLLKNLLDGLERRGVLADLINSRDKFTRESLTYIVNGTKRGQRTWYYVTVKRCMIASFLASEKSGTLNMKNHCEVLLSGLGQNPDDTAKDTIKKIFEKYLQTENDLDDCTPLHLAIWKNNKDAAELLIKHGASITIRDQFGLSALHYAAMKGNEEMCNLLLEHGADIDATDNDGQTAEKVAELNGQTAVQKLLANRKYGM